MSILDVLEITHGREPATESRRLARLEVFVGRSSGNPGEAGLTEPDDVSGDASEPSASHLVGIWVFWCGSFGNG